MAASETTLSNAKLRFACVCASNMNRSMEAHANLAKKGFNVKSFGTGTQVKLPGPSADKPNVYAFGTPYSIIFEDLKGQNLDMYRQNGLLTLVERNSKVKLAPERWQDQANQFDVILTYEEKVFDAVVEGFVAQGSGSFQPVYIFDLNVRDNHEDAMLGAQQTFYLCQQLESSDDWPERLDALVDDFQSRYLRQILHIVQFY